MLDEELEFAPERIKSLMSELDDTYTEFLKDKNEAVDLATEYIDEKVVGKTSYLCRLFTHSSCNNLSRADLLVS